MNEITPKIIDNGSILHKDIQNIIVLLPPAAEIAPRVTPVAPKAMKTAEIVINIIDSVNIIRIHCSSWITENSKIFNYTSAILKKNCMLLPIHIQSWVTTWMIPYY